MVYCGKPSKGCSNCRKRRVKCDQAMPHCGQCNQRQLQCSGYRDLVDLMFRDESEHVIEKVTACRKNIDRRKRAPSTPSSCSSDKSASPIMSTTPLNWTETQTASTFSAGYARRKIHWASSNQGRLCKKQQEIMSVKPPQHSINAEPFLQDHSGVSIYERGMAFFFSRHVSRNDIGYQSYDFIYDIWKSSSKPSPKNGVAAGVVAVGLAGLSKVTRSTEMTTMARRYYGAALKLTTAALSDPTEAIKDTTMLSVLLLSTYEIVSGSTLQTMETWQNHVEGAAALAALRGIGQFKTTAGCKMFQMLCYSVLLSYMRSDGPTPTVIEELSNKYLEMGMLDKTNRNPISHMLQTIAVRHQTKTGAITSKDEIIATLAKCDEEWALLTSGFPYILKISQPQTAYCEPDSHATQQPCIFMV